jgi:hypothetical protein
MFFPALRSRLAVFVSLFLLAGSQGAGPPFHPVAKGPMPYEGTWKVVLPNQRFDLSFWLININKTATRLALVSGADQYASSTFSDLKADAKTIRFTINHPTSRFEFLVLAPKDPMTDTLRGAILVGGNLIPVWLQRTTLTELTKASAFKETPGFGEVQAALKQKESKDRLKGLQEVAALYAGLPIQFLSMQAQIAEHIKEKNDTAKIRAVVESYRKVAVEHGTDFLAGANLDLARNLIDHPKALPVALESAREAVKHLGPDQHFMLKFSAWLTLAAALCKSDKKDDIPPILTELKNLTDQSMRKIKGESLQEIFAYQQLAPLMLGSPVPAITEYGLELVRRAVKLLKEDMPLNVRASTYQLLSRALLSRGKTEELKSLTATFEKIDQEIDQVYTKEFPPFKVEPSKGRKGTSDRVVLVEFFTGAQYPPTVAAYMAYDGALRSYPTKEVAFLQYHVASPDPDVLVNVDTEFRKDSYKSDLEGVPALFVDGGLVRETGGGGQRGKASYDKLKEAISKSLEIEPDAKLKLTVSRTGDTITPKAEVSGLNAKDAKIRLRFALVEEVVRYNGANRVRLHHNVVRAFIGGPGGFELKKPEVTQSATIVLPQLRKLLDDYLEGLTKKFPVQWNEKPMALTKLKVIAFLQNEETKQVLQAAQVDVPGK